jgi:hypothetical protein
VSVRSVVWTGIGIFAVIAFGIHLSEPPPPALQTAAATAVAKDVTPAAPSFSADPAGVYALQRIVSDDFDGYLRGDETLANFDKISPRSETITAPEYWRVYHANEIAADARFLGKPISIAGSVVAVRKDFFGYGWIDLASDANPFMDVHAQLTTAAMAAAARILPGQSVRLQCVGGTMIIGSPSLSDCRIHATALAEARAQIALQVARWFDGKGLPSFAASENAKLGLFTMYYIGTKGGFSKKCLDSLARKECTTNVAAFPEERSELQG